MVLRRKGMLRKSALGNRCSRGRSLISLLESPNILASGTSTRFLSENPIEICDRLKLMLQEKEAEKKIYINSRKKCCYKR